MKWNDCRWNGSGNRDTMLNLYMRRHCRWANIRDYITNPMNSEHCYKHQSAAHYKTNKMQFNHPNHLMVQQNTFISMKSKHTQNSYKSELSAVEAELARTKERRTQRLSHPFDISLQWIWISIGIKFIVYFVPVCVSLARCCVCVCVCSILQSSIAGKGKWHFSRLNS